MMRCLILFAVVCGVAAHGGLTIPPPRNNYHNVDPRNTTRQPGSVFYPQAPPGGPCSGDECLWFSEGCYIGCPSCSSDMPRKGNAFGTPNCSAPALIEPTLPKLFRTVNIDNLSTHGDFTKYHPWRAPGRAPVSDSCGSAGGYRTETDGGGQTPSGSPQFFPGSKLPKLDGVHTEWLAGDAVEVGWMVGVNHGGGYQYSVCPAGTTIDEECFNAHVLPFIGHNTTIRYLDGRGQKIIPAQDVTEGTFPAGSAWRRNPIPSCNCDAGTTCKAAGSNNSAGFASYTNGSNPVPRGFDCPFGTNFDVPFDYGYGQYFWSEAWTHTPMFVMVDKVRAPTVRGEWVLRWRWDVEQNPQVWTHCADITVV